MARPVADTTPDVRPRWRIGEVLRRLGLRRSRQRQVDELRAECASLRALLEGEKRARTEHVAEVRNRLEASIAKVAAGGLDSAAQPRAELETLRQLLANEAHLRAAQVETLRQQQDSAAAGLRVSLSERGADLARMIVRQRAAVCPITPAPAHDAVVAPGDDGRSFEDRLTALRAEAPEAFALWRTLLEVNAHTYQGFPDHSCSVPGHEMAELFGCFLRPYLTGTVLDIGCGPQPVPVYLQGYPPGLVAGIDPLPPPSPHPFTFARAVAEDLPWREGSFDLVVVATSLDHVLLLDRALEEMRRVLAPDGHLLVWVSFVPGAPRYDPRRPDIRGVDEYHLFHFDRTWFEEELARWFQVREVVSFQDIGGSSFYAFVPRPADAAEKASGEPAPA